MTPNRQVSFMYAYPNLIPLSAAKVRQVVGSVEPFVFDRIYGGWFGDETSEVIFGEPDAVVAGAFHPHRRALVVDGGYRVSGRTRPRGHRML